MKYFAFLSVSAATKLKDWNNSMEHIYQNQWLNPENDFAMNQESYMSGDAKFNLL